jgi:hypothetical protein
MNVTVVKKLGGVTVISASVRVSSLEDLILFTQRLGYTQDLTDYIADFETYEDITYQMGLYHEYQ